MGITNYRSRTSLILVVILCTLSLFSKETGILFFVIAILYTFVNDRKDKNALLIICIAASIGYIILRQNVVGLLSNPSNAPITRIALQYRLLTVPSILFFYIKSFIFPLYLSSSYQWVDVSITFYHVILPLIIDVVVLVVLFIVGLNVHHTFSTLFRRYYFFFYGWFIVGLLFHAQLIPLDVTVSERWFYFPIIGLLGMIGVVLHEVLHTKTRRVGAIIGIIIISILSIRTIVRTFDWRNDFTLASHDITVSNDAYDLENTLAIEFLKQGRLDDAKIYALRSVEDFPYMTNYNTLGLVYLNAGDYNKAQESFLTGLTYGDYYVLYDNLAGIYLMTGKPDESIQFLRNAISIFPNDPKLWMSIAVVYYQQNSTDDAKRAISWAYSLDQSPSMTSFYETIMHDQPLNLNFKTR
jgi:hypothetical protein